MAQINIAARSERSGVQRPTGDKVNGQHNAPMQPSVQRISRPPEAKSPRRTETPKLVSHTTRFNVPPSDAGAPSPLGQATWLRPLFVGLLLVALVPNITLAVVLWLGLIDPPWSRHEMPPPAPTVQATAPSPVLTAPATLEAAAGETIKFPIALDNTDGVPARSVIAIQGLPPGSTLSDGRPYGDEWNLKSDQIGDLHLTLPSSAQGEMQIAISLIASDDTVIADTETVLKVNPAPSHPAAQNAAPQPVADNAGEQQARATVEPNETNGETAPADVPPAEQTSAIPSAGAAPPKEPAPVAADASPAGFVQPSVYVNLREGPSSSSRVIGVIAKGARVPVLDRKRGWVQVNNPATSEKGWIYGGYVGEGRHVRSRKKADAAPEQKSDQSSSFWNWLTQ